jgi:hypothetical protein
VLWKYTRATRYAVDASADSAYATIIEASGGGAGAVGAPAIVAIVSVNPRR